MTDRIETMVFVHYTMNNNDLTFRDILRFKQEEYESKTSEEIDALKQERFNQWVSLITAPVEENQETDSVQSESTATL
jgi:hypothetical protein